MLPNEPRVIGRPAIGLDAPEKVTGTARFAFDMQLPGMLHGKILRSPHAHARIRGIDASAALALPGVHAVVTGEDLVGLDPHYGVVIRDQPILAIGKVRYHGDSVAAVVAEDEPTAYRALALIRVDYEILPALMEIEDALAPGSPELFENEAATAPAFLGGGASGQVTPGRNLLYEYSFADGALEPAFARADRVFEDRFTFSRMNHFHLEAHVAVARVAGERIELWGNNQDPFVIRRDISRVFGWPEHRIRIQTEFIGGGFGGKSYCKIEPLAVLLAMKAGRPVRLALSMDESIHTLSQHAMILRLRTGVMTDGRFVAREARIDLNCGSYADASAVVANKVAYRVPGPYRWDAVLSVARCVRTTNIPAGSFRGFGGTQASWASESQIDMIAHRLGADPLELRLRNMKALGEPYMTGDSGLDSDVGAGLRAVAARMGWHGRRREPGRGMGLALGLKDGGGNQRTGNAVVKVGVGGGILVLGGTTEMGQGAVTAMSQIAAETLGAELSRVRYAPLDTEFTPLDQGTRGSSSLTVLGLSIREAAEDARRKILVFAAERLSVPVEALTLEGWEVLDGTTRHSLAAMMDRYYGPYGFEFIGHGTFKVPEDTGAALKSKVLMWIPCWAGAEVTVDEETGHFTVDRLLVAADAGRAINAAGCRGQVEGGAIQALGQTLFETLHYDGEALANGTPLAYRVPLATDLPGRFESLVLEQGHGSGPFGAKGLGEASIMAVHAAVANAIEDAVGVRITELPVTPERVYSALLARPTVPGGGLSLPVGA
jgi:CO/xanthine dehydrogenase Mo-binding subunit